MKTIIYLVCGVVCLGAMNLSAADSQKTDQLHEAFTHVPSAELPAKAVEVIKQTKSSARATMTVQVIKAALDVNPAAAPAIVGAIARAFPDFASVAAGTAAEQQPRQAMAIARSAAAVAPTKAGKIVAAVCRAVPNDYRNVAVAVSQVAPGAGKEILSAISAAIPELKPFIAQALAALNGNVTSVAEVLNQLTSSAQSVAASAPNPEANPAPPIIHALARGPAVGPPYIPLSGTPGNVNPGNTGEVPTGGRGYAAP